MLAITALGSHRPWFLIG